MALVPKISPAFPAVTASVSRPVAGARVASIGDQPIEESSIATDSFFDTSPYEYANDQGRARDGDQDNQQRLPFRHENFGLLNATSEVFAHLFEHEADRGIVDDFGNTHQPSSPPAVSQAITTYEFNSSVINRSASFPGTELSMTL